MPRNLPEVSIVVPVYNGVDTIANCVESLLTQTYPEELVQIVVVDNNSRDGTPDVVRRYPVDLVYETIQTSYAARNRGISVAEADIIAFTDADCVASRDWLSSLIQPFSDPAVGVVGGGIGSQTADQGLVEAFLAHVKGTTESRFHPSEPKAFAAGNVAYRRAALDRVGIFDATMSGGGDVDLAWRVQAYGGYLGVYVPEAVVYHKHRSTLSGLFRMYQRYGFTEMVLTTLYRGETFHRRTPKNQLCLMARQVRALGTYCLSFLVRLTRWRCWRSDCMYLAWPVLSFVLESGSLTGKVRGLFSTRFFSQNPYPTNDQQVSRVQLQLGRCPGRTSAPNKCGCD